MEAKSNSPDELFILQANLLRAFFVVLFTLVALLSGLCCMMSVRASRSRLNRTSYPR